MGGWGDYERQGESESFSQLHKDRLFHLNCVLKTSEGLYSETLQTPPDAWKRRLGFLGKWEEKSSETEHCHSNETTPATINRHWQ